MFLNGQKVACVNADFSNVPPKFLQDYAAFPVKDGIYTIRAIVQGIGGEVACLLAEIHNPPNKVGTENGYNVERFAPLEVITEEKQEYTFASFTS